MWCWKTNATSMKSPQERIIIFSVPVSLNFCSRTNYCYIVSEPVEFGRDSFVNNSLVCQSGIEAITPLSSERIGSK